MDEGLAMCQFAYYGIVAPGDEEEAERIETPKYMAVVSNLSYTYQESVNARGYPAVHTIAEANQDRTLCGKNPEGWSWLGGTLADVNCKTCLRMMRQESKNTPEGQR